MVKLLLDAGAEDHGQLLLQYCIKHAHLKLAELLFAWGCLKRRHDRNDPLWMDLSHRNVGPTVVQPALWRLCGGGPLTRWLVAAVVNAAPKLSLLLPFPPADNRAAVSWSLHAAVITHVSLSGCSLDRFPWCIVGDLPNLQVRKPRLIWQFNVHTVIVVSLNIVEYLIFDDQLARSNQALNPVLLA